MSPGWLDEGSALDSGGQVRILLFHGLFLVLEIINLGPRDLDHDTSRGELGEQIEFRFSKIRQPVDDDLILLNHFVG